jgi:hypothetical protein
MNYWRGSYCRCCGAPLQVGHGVVVGCNRAHFGLPLCQFCGQNTCGAHSHNQQGPWQVRRYCEIGGEQCAPTGACPVHGMQQG